MSRSLEALEEEPAQTCESVGWLLSEGPDVVRLVTTVAGEEVSGIVIPMGCVVSIHRHE